MEHILIFINYSGKTPKNHLDNNLKHSANEEEDIVKKLLHIFCCSPVSQDLNYCPEGWGNNYKSTIIVASPEKIFLKEKFFRNITLNNNIKSNDSIKLLMIQYFNIVNSTHVMIFKRQLKLKFKL